jgi:hypothetical protein
MSPTVVNNVETLCNIKHIIAMGGAEFAKIGRPNNTGTRILCVSGHVNKPGYYEFELGSLTLGELINDVCGGIRGGRKLKAIIPGGSSAKVLRADERFKIKTKQADGSMADREIGVLDIPKKSPRAWRRARAATMTLPCSRTWRTTSRVEPFARSVKRARGRHRASLTSSGVNLSPRRGRAR